MVEAIVAAAGRVPGRNPYAISIIAADGRFVDKVVTGRTALRCVLEQAEHLYLALNRRRQQRSELELAADFERIEAAARRLLAALKVGPDHDVAAMPADLRRGGLQAFAAIEAHASAGGRAGSPHDASDGEALLRCAVRGVGRLARWAGAARERAKRRASIGPVKPRNQGDRALDAFIVHVVDNGWCLIYGRQPTDSAPLRRFVRAAARGIGRPLSDDAARERLRRLMERRGKSKGRNP